MPDLPIIRDAVHPENMTIDSSYAGVLAYRDGGTRWPVAQVNRYLKAGKLIYPITVLGSDPHRAQIADCERGDLTPQSAAVWAHNRNQLHADATVYVGKANVPQLLDALGMEPCWLWVADWTGHEHSESLNLPAHVKLAAVQYANVNDEYDLSAIMSTAWPAHPWRPGAGAW